MYIIPYALSAFLIGLHTITRIVSNIYRMCRNYFMRIAKDPPNCCCANSEPPFFLFLSAPCLLVFWTWKHFMIAVRSCVCICMYMTKWYVVHTQHCKTLYNGISLCVYYCTVMCKWDILCYACKWWYFCRHSTYARRVCVILLIWFFVIEIPIVIVAANAMLAPNKSCMPSISKMSN